MLQKIKERFAAGLFCVSLGKDHGNVVTPGGTNHARSAFADGGQRNEFGRQTIVGGAGAHQNNRLMRESHELFFCKAKSDS